MDHFAQLLRARKAKLSVLWSEMKEFNSGILLQWTMVLRRSPSPNLGDARFSKWILCAFTPIRDSTRRIKIQVWKWDRAAVPNLFSKCRVGRYRYIRYIPGTPVYTVLIEYVRRNGFWAQTGYQRRGVEFFHALSLPKPEPVLVHRSVVGKNPKDLSSKIRASFVLFSWGRALQIASIST